MALKEQSQRTKKVTKHGRQNIDSQRNHLQPPSLCCQKNKGKYICPMWQISWVWLKSFLEIRLLSCQQWQDNECCFVHPLICCVMIRLLITGWEKKNASESEDKDIPRKVVEAANYSKVRNILCCLQGGEKGFYYYCIPLLFQFNSIPFAWRQTTTNIISRRFYIVRSRRPQYDRGSPTGPTMNKHLATVEKKNGRKTFLCSMSSTFICERKFCEIVLKPCPDFVG